MLVAGIAITSLAIAPGNISTDSGQHIPGKTPTPSPDDFALNEITIDQLQKKMQSGEYTSRSVTEMYLRRIDAIDKKGPALNAGPGRLAERPFATRAAHAAELRTGRRGRT